MRTSSENDAPAPVEPGRVAVGASVDPMDENVEVRVPRTSRRAWRRGWIVAIVVIVVVLAVLLALLITHQSSPSKEPGNTQYNIAPVAPR